VVAEALATLSSGAKFFRADLHIHSFGASHDVRDTTATPAEILATAARERLAIISLTDHNEIAKVISSVTLPQLTRLSVSSIGSRLRIGAPPTVAVKRVRSNALS
jgi:hypothetical protein